MAFSVGDYARWAEVFCEPLFCHLMFFQGEGEMDGVIAEANNVAVYFFKGEREGEALNRWGWHSRSRGNIHSQFL